MRPVNRPLPPAIRKIKTPKESSDFFEVLKKVLVIRKSTRIMESCQADSLRPVQYSTASCCQWNMTRVGRRCQERQSHNPEVR